MNVPSAGITSATTSTYCHRDWRRHHGNPRATLTATITIGSMTRIPYGVAHDATLTELAELQRRRSRKARSVRRQSVAMFVAGVFSMFVFFPIKLAALLFFYKSLETFLISQRLAARHARLVLAEKNAKPVLYLRSFDADDSVGKNRLTVAKSLGLMLAGPMMVVAVLWKKRSAEEEMVKQVGRIGPVVAIGRPDERSQNWEPIDSTRRTTIGRKKSFASSE